VGIADAFIISVGVTAASVAVAFFMREVPLRKSYGPPVAVEGVLPDPPIAEADAPMDDASRAPTEGGRSRGAWPGRLLVVTATAVAGLVLALLRARQQGPPDPP
jgi:hypothetical protein